MKLFGGDLKTCQTGLGDEHQELFLFLFENIHFLWFKMKYLGG